MLNAERKKRFGAARRTQPIRLTGESMPAQDSEPVELVLDYGQVLDRGLARERNEDRCGWFIPTDMALRRERGRLFVVADGMGGHQAGDVAAEIAVASINEAYFLSRSWNDAASKLRTAFLSANDSILTAAREQDHQGMGAAVVAAVVVRDRAYVAHIGDARAYLIRGRQVTQLTNDHSWVQDRIDAGRLTQEEARIHPYRNVLTRALGVDPDGTPDVSEFALTPGDTMILCSDGLWGVVPDDVIARTIAETEGAAVTARALVDLALAGGGPDNISVIVVRIAGPNTEAPTVQISLRRDE
jgi:serine/threonine protein phosphatase PrpC